MCGRADTCLSGPHDAVTSAPTHTWDAPWANATDADADSARKAHKNSDNRIVVGKTVGAGCDQTTCGGSPNVRPCGRVHSFIDGVASLAPVWRQFGASLAPVWESDVWPPVHARGECVSAGRRESAAGLEARAGTRNVMSMWVGLAISLTLIECKLRRAGVREQPTPRCAVHAPQQSQAHTFAVRRCTALRAAPPQRYGAMRVRTGRHCCRPLQAAASPCRTCAHTHRAT